MMRSTRERYWIPWTLKSGALSSVEKDGLLARGHGILIAMDPAFQGPPAIGEVAAKSSRSRSSLADLKSPSSLSVICPDQKPSTIRSIPLGVFDEGLRQICLMTSNTDLFLNGWETRTSFTCSTIVWGALAKTLRMWNQFGAELRSVGIEMSGADS